jgi:glucose-6-phosphate 1-dehydrogenase
MPTTIVIFGASGDLTGRKLIPALYELFRKKRLAEPTRIVGFSRSPFSHEAWRTRLAESTAQHLAGSFDAAVWAEFAPSLFYHAGDIGTVEDFAALGRLLGEIEGPAPAARVYYLATAPQFFEPAIAHLGAAHMAGAGPPPRRIVIEKPFGTDRASARQLNEAVHRVFAEGQVYRIDHYLGKETVQNLLVLRFANSIFEPVWNRNFIDHVQITMAEELTVEHRAAYYDTVGVLRDMFQNHLLQLLTLTAMESPSAYEGDAIRDEKVKVLRAIRPMTRENVLRSTIRGQYRKYRDEPGVPPDSQTATFGAVKFLVDNWRWQGVPFFVRSGKAMPCRTTQIVIQFRQPPHMLFPDGPRDVAGSNRLVIQVQPAEGIQLHFYTKVPDAGMKLRQTDLSFQFYEQFHAPMPEAYQRLLLDVIHGDPGLFARADEIELAWAIIDPIRTVWSEGGEPPLHFYEAGQWGPPTAAAWIARQNREWFDYCPVLGHNSQGAE